MYNSPLLMYTVHVHCVLFIGPIEQLPDYNRVRGNMYWARS